jgi:tRNA threonylcarbamoyl adenosine modification protein YeaZ
MGVTRELGGLEVATLSASIPAASRIMQILAIDTASPRPAVSLFAGGALFEETLPSDRRSSEALLPAIARVLGAARTRLEDCDRLAVCAGPGSFTGIRIGLATAWGLSRASGVPVEAVSTLEALGESARESGAPRVAAVLDAGRGELVVERFALDEARARSLSPPARVPAADVVAAAAGDPIVELPAGLTGGPALAPAAVPATAVALAVSRAPGDVASAPVSATYSRPSAAEAAREAAQKGERRGPA